MATEVFYSSASDGQITCQAFAIGGRESAGEVWDAAHDNDGGGGPGITIGREVAGDTFTVGTRNITPYASAGMYIYRCFLFFDTAGLNPAAVITGLTLSLHIESEYSGGAHGVQPWSIVVQTDVGAAPHDPLIDADYGYTQYSGNHGELAQADFAAGYNDITLPTTLLTPGGTLLLVLRSSRDVDNDRGVPDTYSLCSIYSADKGAGFLPRLTVTYTLAPAGVTYFSDAKDGHLANESSSWQAAWEATTASNAPVIAEEYITVGTFIPPPNYWIHRGYLYFNTAALPDEAIIMAVTLSLYGRTSSFAAYPNDYVRILNGQPAHPEDPLVQTDYDKDFYVAGPRLTCVGWSDVGYNDILFDADHFSWINKTGWTKLCVQLQSEDDGDSPGNDFQYFTFWSADEAQAGERRPKLLVEYKIIGQGTATIECTATVVPRIIARPALITATATVDATAYRSALHRETLAYTGTLAAGDSVAIDTGKMKATHWPASGGAISVPQYLSGMPLDLLPGTNILHYNDDEAARTVGISIHHKPRDA